MAYVEIDIEGSRALGQVLRDTASRAETVRRQIVGALSLAELTSQAPLQLALVQDGLATLGTGVLDKAAVAESFVIDPRGTASTLGVAEADLATALVTLLGLAGPRDLRDVLVALPGAGADPALDAALVRLTPVLLPALLGGQRPALTDEQRAALLPDLRVLALALGIEHVGPPGRPVEEQQSGGFLGLFRRRAETRTTEVFWKDFWADGRSVDEVLVDPGQLLDWITGTAELDLRLSRAVDLPQLGDVLASHDFATTNSAPAELAALLAAAELEFAAIADWLPGFLVGRTSAGPDTTQLDQTLAFADRVGWVDPGPAAATTDARFAAAVAFLRANRMVQGALLPTGFEGDSDPFMFVNETGLARTVELGRRSGVVTDAYTAGIAELADRLMAGVGVDLASASPVELTEAVQRQLFALVASQLPAALAQSPSIQAQFVGALSFLRGATDGPQLRERVVQVTAAFRTLAMVGGPALTERELTAIVGGAALDALGRSRLRLRSREAVEASPEFLILARQWGIPGTRKQDLGKYKFGFTFDELGVLTAISRTKKKKKSFLSRVVDTIKSVGKAIVASWKDNPFKAIFQVGKIALGVASLVVPGLQAVGIATLAINAVEAVSHAIDGNWLGAIGAGLSALTGGANLLAAGAGAAGLVGQTAAVAQLFDIQGTLEVLTTAKRAFDIGTSVIQATRADNLVDAITAGLRAVGSTLTNGAELLKPLGAGSAFAEELQRLGASVQDISRLVGPSAALVQALDRGDPLGLLSNGLSIISTGAQALLNPGGVQLFDFGPQTRRELADLATGTGIVGNLARAIAAANAGRPASAALALAQAAQINDRTSRDAAIAQRLAEVGVVIEGVFHGADPAAAAPALIQRLDGVIRSLRPVGRSAASPTSVISRPVPGDGPTPPDATDAAAQVATSGGQILLSGSADGLVLAQGSGQTMGGMRLRMPDGQTVPLPPGTHVVPPGAQLITPGGEVYGGTDGLTPPFKGEFGFPNGFHTVPGGMLIIEGAPGTSPSIIYFPDDPSGVPQSLLDPVGGQPVANLA
ncbi:hypothetical protein [Micromonospora sp. NBC_01813]|uniref:hypothetical protein n=1 Tax=Micromonospora sp. NBC_01813 TaxID=2975988 RepID=UPI002DD89C5F|nr:hypothetical protein [Micromonospora sp. NBC_01813]WSA10163.1 hypothetical protein OG958_05030 [Micromonospora sp. NBC_01813]